MQNVQLILGFIVALVLTWALFRQFQNKQIVYLKQGEDSLFRDIKSLFEDAEIKQGDAIGTWKLYGKFKGRFFQVQTIVDTLATRKLPILWLMITMPRPLPISGSTNLMMRPSGPTSFSNFDFLPYTIPLPANFPEHAVLKTDGANFVSPILEISSHLELFHNGTGKELLVSPKGLRIVAVAAQADRARYGVFREANFGDTVIETDLAESILNTLISLHKSLEQNYA